MIKNLVERRRKGDEGFTLVELLIVIVILGILAAIVVFAVGGISDRGQQKACDTDKRSIAAAEEAYLAAGKSGTTPAQYGSETQLVSAGLLQAESTLHNVTVPAGGASYTITAVAPCT